MELPSIQVKHEDKTYKIVFLNKEVKDKYVIDEAEYCESARNVRQTCRIKELSLAKFALASKQLKFAYERGYALTTKTGNVLMFNTAKQEHILA